MKPIIGICSRKVLINEYQPCGDRCCVNLSYSKMVLACGGIPIIIPRIVDKETLNEICEHIDFLLICGNSMHPRHNTIPKNVDENLVMDKTTCLRDEILVKKCIELNKGIIGICYGMQFLNSYFGGSIYMDIVKQLNVESHMKTVHYVNIVKNTKFQKLLKKDRIIVNSYHYAGITEDTISKELIINTIGDDGIIEGFEIPNKNIYGFQYHIEKHEELFFIIKNLIKNS